MKLSKYAPFLVSDPRDEMIRFVTGVSDDLQEKCHSAMLNYNMNISRPMVHAKHVEEARAKRKNRDAKRARSFDGDSSKNMIEIQDKSRFKKRISNQVPSNFPKNSGYRMDNPKPKKGKGTSSPTEKPTCGSTMAPKKNHFYALRSRCEQETSPDVVTGMLKIFSIDGYALLDSGATLSFVTPLVAKKFDILPDILHEHFLMSTPVSEYVVAKKDKGGEV
ncbi:uncharacterized protein [Solanum lycopersicum]|uniref:uncharacterized protein n=1 Tax=Solanum lycopersicum TaxID=4081 RepID=UPI00374934B4